MGTKWNYLNKFDSLARTSLDTPWNYYENKLFDQFIYPT